MKHIILLHGALGHAAQFENLSQLLKDKYIVHTFDFAGHGLTNSPHASRIQDFKDQLIGLLDQLRNEEVYIFGHSMGGYVALMAALENIHNIKKIYTLGTMMFWNEDLALRESKMLDAEKMMEKIPAFAKALQTIHSDWKLLLSATAEVLSDLGKNNYLRQEKLAEITIPVRIALGDRDTSAGIENSVVAFQTLQNGSMQIFPETPHPYQKVNVNKLAEALDEFFKD